MKQHPEQIEKLNAALQTKRLGRYCRWYDTVDSTNSVALTWAKDGAPPGALVVAEFQEHGRGRFKRSWTADPGSNLTFSLVADALVGSSNRLGLMPIALAVAVAETISRNVAPHQPSIKWPNDILLAGKKICGILVESSIPSSQTSHRGHIVAGIGINVNQPSFPPDLAESAASIFLVHGRPLDRIQLLAEVLLSVESVLETLSAGEIGELIDRYESFLAGLGKTVRFTRVGSQTDAEGTILGVDPSGGLRVRTRSQIETLTTGEVTFRRETPRESGVNRLSDPRELTSSS